MIKTGDPFVAVLLVLIVGHLTPSPLRWLQMSGMTKLLFIAVRYFVANMCGWVR